MLIRLFFCTQSQTLVDADSTYQIGGQILKLKTELVLKNKGDVFVSSWSKDLLKAMREKAKKKQATKNLFNPRMPILRSELAFALC